MKTAQKPKTKYPVYPEQFKMRIDRLEDHAKNHPIMFRVAPIAASECEMVLHAYFGGTYRMLWALFKKAVWLDCNSWWCGLIFWFSDFVGWTKLVPVPETDTTIAHIQRHGGKCHGSPNCSQDCIDRDQPRWFRKMFLSRYEA